MKIPSRLRRPWLLWPAAIALAAATWWLAAGQPSAEREAAPVATRPAVPPAAIPAAPESSPQAAAAEAPDIFAARTWELPEPPAAELPVDAEAPAPPPPPEAPPLPFRYLGKVEEPGVATVVFLVKDEQVLAVRPGDAINGTYRVVRLSNDEVRFLYRPLKIEQALSMGSST